MKKKFQNILNKLLPVSLIAVLLGIWFAVTEFKFVEPFLLPSPIAVAQAFVENFGVLMAHAATSMTESFLGLGLALALAFVLAIAMDRFDLIRRTVFPVLVISQTIPVIAIAPLLVLWLGYGIEPKVALILIVCFFPISVGLLSGLKTADEDTINLMRSMGASRRQILVHVKLPSSMEAFFAGLKIAVSYAIVGAIIAEWLGGESGLGVYMTAVRRSYAFDKMFAVILLVIILSLALVACVSFIEKKSMPWRVKK
ncbi:MAG: ABC transporter permease [Clostridia bacterium]